MSSQPSTLMAQIKAWLTDRYRLAFLAFAAVYAAILLLNLANQPMNWDEVTHLNGALYLNSGQFSKFVSNSFYPPLFDGVTAIFFQAFGVSLFSARLVPALFSVLTFCAVFELAYNMYSGKVALLSAFLLGIMPGYFWLSRVALLETMLDFFLVLAFLFFFRWLRNRKDRYMVFCGVALGMGFLAKYQMLVAGVVIVVSLLFLARGQLKHAFTRFSLAAIAAVLVVVPWFAAVYQVYASKTLSEWFYALQVGNPERAVYSDRYPSPAFYLIEMVWPYNQIHPVSPLIYIAGLMGLGLLIWRHRKSDQFVLIWFTVVLVFFTFIENKEWRYVLTLFPALAISAAVLIFAVYGKLGDVLKRQVNFKRRRIVQIAAGVFLVLVAGSVASSINDAYYPVAFYDIKIDIQDATQYAVQHLEANRSIMVLCPFNFLSKDMVNFYLWQDGAKNIQTYQYPTMPTDTYTPKFNITEFIAQCRQNNVKLVFAYEQGGTYPYYNTTLTPQQVFAQLYDSGNFSEINPNATFGANPRRIFVLSFTG